MMTSTDREVVRLAQRCLDIVIDHDKYESQRGLWRQVQKRRFLLYNEQYMRTFAEDEGEDSWLDDGTWEETVRKAHEKAAYEDDVRSADDSFEETTAWSPGSPMAIGRHNHVAMDFETVGYPQADDGSGWDRQYAGAGAGARAGASAGAGAGAGSAAGAGASYGDGDFW